MDILFVHLNSKRGASCQTILAKTSIIYVMEAHHRVKIHNGCLIGYREVDSKMQNEHED